MHTAAGANISGVAAQAIGAELDLTDKGLGIRSRRYTLLAEDGVVRYLPSCHMAMQCVQSLQIDSAMSVCCV